MRGLVGLITTVAAGAFMVVLSVYPGQIVLWNGIGPILFHVLIPGVVAAGIFVWIVHQPTVESISESSLLSFCLTAVFILALEVAQIPIPSRLAENVDVLVGLGGAGFGLCVTVLVFNRYQERLL